jgi:hypothetical protein
MSRHANLPFHLYVNVDNRFLGPNMPPGTTPAIWHGVYARPYQTLYCHVLLESGAHWSGLPLHALSTTQDFSLARENLMPWGSMGDETEAWHANYMEGLRCSVHAPFKGDGRHTGIIIDWTDGFSRYPAEHKPLSLVHLDTGQFALLPNNYLMFEDAHFVELKARENTKHYSRGETVYWEKA